jgi:hypothetical protein
MKVTGGQLIAVNPGEALESVSKQLGSAAVPSGERRVVAFGGNTYMSNGVIAHVRISRTNEDLSRPLGILIHSTKAVTQALEPVDFEDAAFPSIQAKLFDLVKPTLRQIRKDAGAVCSCDLNGDGVFTVSDLQLLQSMRIADVGIRCDVTQDGALDDEDFGAVVNAINGKGCVRSGRSNTSKAPITRAEEK